MKDARAVLLDVDDTLYPRDCGLWYAVRDRIQAFIESQLGVSPEAAADLRSRYLSQYGTTLRGLQNEYSVDPFEYLDYVHDVPVASYLRSDPVLRNLLHGATLPIYLFSNAYSAHVERVLAALGLADLPIKVIDIVALDFQNKPLQGAYDRALVLAGITDPASAIMIDDRSANLIPAKAQKMYTVLVGPAANGFHPDLRIDHIHMLHSCLPDIVPGSLVD
jgi:putative hydrolase of the HAD superfamily